MEVYNIDVDVNLKENRVVATVTLTFKIFAGGMFKEWTVVDFDFDDNLNEVLTLIIREGGKYFKEVRMYDKSKHDVRVVEFKELSEDEVVKIIRDRITDLIKYIFKHYEEEGKS
jgi:hypothetical protein